MERTCPQPSEIMSQGTHESRRHTIAHEDSEVYSVTGWGAMFESRKVFDHRSATDAIITVHVLPTSVLTTV